MRAQICLNKLPGKLSVNPHRLTMCGLIIPANFSNELNFSIFI